MLLVSCTKDDPSWDVDLNVPIAHASLGIKDFVADSLLSEDAEKNLTLVLDFDLLKISTDTLVSLPDSLYYAKYKMPFGITVPPNTKVFDKTETKFYKLKDAILTEAKIKTGKIAIKAFNYLKTSAYIEYVLDNSLLNGKPIALSGIVPGLSATNNTLEQEYDVSGTYLDLRQPKNKYNTLKSTIRIFSDPNATENVKINYNDSLEILVEFKDIVVEYARGYFGQHNITVNGNEEISYIKDFGINYLDIDDVSMCISLENYFGADLGFTVNKISSHGNADLDLVADCIGKQINMTRAVEGPYQNVIPSNKIINFNGSNIIQFIENLPYAISYDVRADINSMGNISTGNDFVFSARGFESRMHLELPLSFALKGLKLTDTIDYDLKKSKVRLAKSELTINVENSFPFSASLDIKLINDGAVIDSIKPNNEIFAANVDENGNVISSAKQIIKIGLDENQTKSLYDCKKAVITAKINTGGNANQKVKLNASNKIDIVLTGLFNMFLNEKL
jgi:hypothetical protein